MGVYILLVCLCSCVCAFLCVRVCVYVSQITSMHLLVPVEGRITFHKLEAGEVRLEYRGGGGGGGVKERGRRDEWC